MSDQMNIGLYASDIQGFNLGAWRYPNARIGSENFDYQVEMAQKAEAAKLDAVFYADGPYTDATMGVGVVVRYDPLVLLAGIAARTHHIGLAATANTTYDQPYHIARRFSSLDHLSGGRAAWNVVTGTQAKMGNNFNGISLPDGAERYAQADEFVDVVKGLWDTWADDAFPMNPETGVYFDPSKMRQLNHEGKYFKVEGALNSSRPPQGHPIVILAGGSIAGRQVAAKQADVMFTVESDLDAAVKFRNEMRVAVTAAGRNPDHFKIMPGLTVIVGATEAEAKRRLSDLAELGNTETAMNILCARLEFDLRGYDLDGHLPEVVLSKNLSGYPVNIVRLARKHNMTIRQLRDHTAASYSHHFLCGSAEQVADGMEGWFRSGACDGFNVMPSTNPTDLDNFLQGVVPLLQKKGVFRQDYKGKTLRDHLGLPQVARR